MDRLGLPGDDLPALCIPAQRLVLILGAAPHTGHLLHLSREGGGCRRNVGVTDVLPRVGLQRLATAWWWCWWCWVWVGVGVHIVERAGGSQAESVGVLGWGAPVLDGRIDGKGVHRGLLRTACQGVWARCGPLRRRRLDTPHAYKRVRGRLLAHLASYVVVLTPSLKVPLYVRSSGSSFGVSRLAAPAAPQGCERANAHRGQVINTDGGGGVCACRGYPGQTCPTQSPGAKLLLLLGLTHTAPASLVPSAERLC